MKPAAIILVLLFFLAPVFGDELTFSPSARVSLRGAEKEAVAERLRQSAISGESKRTLIEMLNAADESNYAPPGIPRNENYEALCARVVSRLFSHVFGGEEDPSRARGVSGNAWDMGQNVRTFGGYVFPWDAGASAQLRTGDIIGIYYTHSIYNEPQRGRKYTHVAMVIDNLPGRGPLIAHWWDPGKFLAPSAEQPWFFRLEFLEDLLDAFPGFFIPREVMRPRNIFYQEES
jgi:hypothetical protein